MKRLQLPNQSEVQTTPQSTNYVFNCLDIYGIVPTMIWYANIHYSPLNTAITTYNSQYDYYNHWRNETLSKGKTPSTLIFILTHLHRFYPLDSQLPLTYHELTVPLHFHCLQMHHTHPSTLPYWFGTHFPHCVITLLSTSFFILWNMEWNTNLTTLFWIHSHSDTHQSSQLYYFIHTHTRITTQSILRASLSLPLSEYYS